MEIENKWEEYSKRFEEKEREVLHRSPIFFERCQWIECGYGWLDPIDRLAIEIEKLSEINMKLDRRFSGHRAVQIKQKFGGLRVYMERSDEKVDNLIKVAEDVCAETCETCGGAGKLRNGGWITVKCDACMEAK